MLRELRIRDFAIIDDLTITFRPGLNVITGETGAGKSILIQALGLLCGGRATPEVVRDQTEAASIEGVFDIPGERENFAAYGIEPDDELIVRRVIPRTGKGRVYLNGSPATVAMLSQVGTRLVHLYGQHDQALLLHPASHLDFLDEFGALAELRTRMAAAYAALAAARATLHELRQRRDTRQERQELLRFQIQELAAAAVEPDEESALRRERETVRHAERLQQACHDAEVTLYSGESAMTSALARIATQLKELTRIDEALGEPAELIDTARVQLEDAALRLRDHADRIHFDPERLEAIEDRLALLGHLSRKYRVPTTDLPTSLDTLRGELGAIEASVADCVDAEGRVAALTQDALAIAGELSAARRAAAQRLENEMAQELSALGLAGATFRVVREASATDAGADHLQPTGIDSLEFHLSANPGEAPKPLAHIASGGELSRIMLALKAMTATAVETPILVFDEVDAGIGGEVAAAVARRLTALAHTRQLLCITHLPQIAAYADYHFAVEKRVSRGRTVTHARVLEADERVAELSRMLGGTVAPTEAARYARRLIAQARTATPR